jgi:molybdopterin-guanine dinucleotide biosynthesis protein A
MRVGIFVGGRSTRMGGKPKGLLPAPDSGEALVVRSCRLARAAGLSPCLIGAAEAYRALLPDLEVVADAPGGIGPLGGLLGLVRSAGAAPVLALACDMPHITQELLARLAGEEASGDVLSPRGESGLWEPLCARYDGARVSAPLERAVAAGVRSFQRLFTQLQVSELALAPHERAALVDWDRPEDIDG